jgi:hypothetical protein
VNRKIEKKKTYAPRRVSKRRPSGLQHSVSTTTLPRFIRNTKMSGVPVRSKRNIPCGLLDNLWKVIGSVQIGQVHAPSGCSSGRFSVTSSCPLRRTDPFSISSCRVSSLFVVLFAGHRAVSRWPKMRLRKMLLLKLSSGPSH